MPNASELAQLHDIHLPEPIGWWPLGPGWYLLMALLLAMFIISGVVLGRYLLHRRARNQALRLLATYQELYEKNADSQLSAACVSELLKRVALAYFPRERVAGLQGSAWILFLNETAKGLDFETVRAALLEAPYQPSKEIDLSQLFVLTQAWIRKRRRPCLK